MSRHFRVTIPLRSILEAFTVVALVVAYGLQYRHALESTPDDRNALPRSYVVFAALFALFQLCDYFVDDIYGVGFEGRCPGALRGIRFWETTGGAWLLGVQILGALGLCIVYTILSRRSQKHLEDAITGTEEGALSPSPQAATEQTPLLSPPSDAAARSPAGQEGDNIDLTYPAILVLSTIATFLLLLLLILSPPVIDIGIIMLVLGIITTIALLILLFLTLPERYDYTANLTLTSLLTLLTLSLSALYASTLKWPEMGWEGLGRNLAIYMLRMPVLLFSSLFLFLQYLSIFRRLSLAHDTGLNLSSVVFRLLAQIAVLGRLIQRAERRWRVERQWCQLSEREPGWWTGCEVEAGHVWGDGRFWVFSAQARMLYSTAFMVVVAGLMVWRGLRGRDGLQQEESDE